MISVQLPDGSARSLSEGASSADLAADIGPGLARVAVAARVNGEVTDLNRQLADGDQVAILTKRDAEALEVLRHSAAHLMADAFCVGFFFASFSGIYLLLRRFVDHTPLDEVFVIDDKTKYGLDDLIQQTAEQSTE